MPDKARIPEEVFILFQFEGENGMVCTFFNSGGVMII